MRRIEARYDRSLETILRTLYLDESQTVQEIAAELDVPLGTAYGWLTRFGLTKSQRIVQLQSELAAATSAGPS